MGSVARHPARRPVYSLHPQMELLLFFPLTIISFIFPFIVSVSAGPSGLALIAVGTGTVNNLTNLMSGKLLNELRLHPIISGRGCQA